MAHKVLDEGIEPVTTPEERLAMAVLWRAISDYWLKMKTGRKAGDAKRKDREQLIHLDDYADEWFNDPEMRAYSYVWTCELLNVDHEKLLRSIKKGPSRKQKRLMNVARRAL